MAQFNLFTVCLLLALAVSLFSLQADAACCTTYSKGEIPKHRINGLTIQTITGKCNIKAIIMHTVRGRKVCVDPTKPWVMDILQELRNKVKQMSSTNSQTQGQ